MNFREATSADRDRILALRARCFGDVDPEVLDWEFARGRAFIGEEDGQLLTHVALVRWQEHLLAVEAMTSPDARGRGAFTDLLGFALANRGDALVTAFQIRAAVAGSLMRTGWGLHARVPVLLRPVPLWKGKRDPFPALTRDDVAWMSAIARTEEFLAWRFFDNPHWQYRVTGVENAAYLVTRRTKLKGIETCAIVDLAWRDRRIAKALLRDALDRAKADRCILAAALVSRDHPAFGLLLRHGFLPGPYRFRYLVYPPEHAKRRWPLMWADTDHL
jgi:ribosomal protein S18 acetylase RimI-like enzyme